MAKEYVINGKKVIGWFRRGKARIPRFEDGTIGRNQELTKFGEKKRFTRQELIDRYGTDNVDLINAGREAENRVELKTERQIKSENKALENLKNKTLAQRAKEIDKYNNIYGEDRSFAGWELYSDDPHRFDDILKKDNIDKGLKREYNTKNGFNLGNELEKTQSTVDKVLNDGEYYNIETSRDGNNIVLKDYITGKSTKVSANDTSKNIQNKIDKMYNNTSEYDRIREKGVDKTEYDVLGVSKDSTGETIYKVNENGKERWMQGEQFDNLSNYEVYDKADQLSRETSDYKLRDTINKKLNSIDRANKKGEGYADKQTNELRDILKNQNEGFTQHTDMYGGTREYTSDDLSRMKEAGIKPMKHSYTGGGWEGEKSNLNLSTAEQAKAITNAMKEAYPDVKIERKSQNYSGGSSITFSVVSSGKDLFKSDKDIDKMNYSDFGHLTSSWGFERWAKENVPTYESNHSFNIDDVRRYAKQDLANSRKSDIQSVSGNEWYLSDYGKEVMTELNKQANSYTYDDSDGMVDYFNHGTYMWVNIGKYDKPYQVTGSKSSASKGGNTSLSKMSISELRTMANNYGLEANGLTKKQLMAKLISVFNK